MRRRTKLSIKRKISGTMAGLLAAISVMTSVSSIPAYATESNVKFSYEKKEEEKVGVYVQASNETFAAGEEVQLTVTVRNNTEETLTNGMLKATDSKNALENASFVYTVSEDGESAAIATPGEAEMSVSQESDSENTASPAAETASAETDAASEEIEISGPASDTPAETAAYGPASDTGEDGTTTQDDESEFDEETYKADATYSVPYMDEEGNIRNITLAPGESFEVPYKGTVDSSIYGVVNRELRFSFSARKENGKKISNYSKFTFNTGMMTLLPVAMEEDEIGADEDGTMVLHLGLDNMEFMFDDEGGSGGSGRGPAAATPPEAGAATPSEAEKAETEATPSESEIVETPENDAAEATPSEAEKEMTPEADTAETPEMEATPSEAEEDEEDEPETDVVIVGDASEEEDEATPAEAEKGTPSEIDRSSKHSSDDDDEPDDSDDVFEKEDIKYEVWTYGIELEDITASFDEAACGPAESVVVIDYHVAADTEPGTYFGKVTASYKYHGKTYKTTQGFEIEVAGESELVLKGEYNGAEIEVKGLRSSFPRGKRLHLQISELSEEQKALLETAMKKIAEETGTTIDEMAAVDIKVIADGIPQELRGPVNVTFTNIKLKNVRETENGLLDTIAEIFNTGEKSDAKNLKVWHLNEEKATLDQMESSVGEDGSVQMETDHFSGFMLANSEIYTADAKADDKTVVDGDKGITFKLFDYSEHINKADENHNSWRPISNYFTFRGTVWTNAGATGETATETTHVPTGGSLGSSGINATYDEDGYTENHATVARKLDSNHMPVLDPERAVKANGTSRAATDLTETQKSLAYLFSNWDHAVMAYEPENTILQKDGNRYYYNSADNAVDYDIANRVFRVRNYAERNSTTAGFAGYSDFMPFNYTGGKLKGKHGDTDLDYHINSGIESSANGNGDTDYWFGMTMDVDFFQSFNGKLGNDDMIFNFSGDDDVWVFIDDVLVLDLGGTHGTVNGQINFATGEVLQYLSWGGANDTNEERTGGSETSFPTTLRAQFEAAGKNDVQWKNVGTEEKPEYIFADYSQHQLKFFYMERGSAVANCALDFTLPTLPDKSLMVTKVLNTKDTGEVAAYLEDTLSYKFRVVKADASGKATETLFIPAGTSYKIWENGVETNQTGTVGDDGYFTLKANQSAAFANMMEMFSGAQHVNYIVEEVMPNELTGQYEKVSYQVSSEAGYVKSEGAAVTEFTTYQTEALTSQETHAVTYQNTIDTNQLSSLSIKKESAPGSEFKEDDSFQMEVKLGESETDVMPLPVGTRYTINKEGVDPVAKTVETAGIIPLKIGETAVITEQILAGTYYEVQEMLEGDYAVDSYQRPANSKDTEEAQKNGVVCTSDKASGTVTPGESILITVTNRDYDFSVVIPITKEFVGNTTEGVCSFTVEKVTKKDNGDGTFSWDVDESKPGTEIAISGSAVANGRIVIGLENGEDRTEYYKISESKTWSNQTIYDETFYIAEIVISGNAVKKTMLYKNGTEEMTGTLPFVNWNAITLTVDKTVVGSLATLTEAFKFSVQVEVPGKEFAFAESAEGEYSVSETDADIVKFDLIHRQSIQISVPVGSIITVTEDSYPGFIASYKIGEGDTVYENSAVIGSPESPVNSAVSVHFTNTTGAMLPATGGPGTLKLTYGGILAMITAAGYLLLSERKQRRKEENATV